MDKDLEQEIADILKDKPFTMPIIYNKPYHENYISDWLAFILNPEINGLENKPLNILLSLAKNKEHKKIENDEYADFSKPREIPLGENGRIDFLIPVYKNIKDKNNNQSPLYYIAIENKTFAEEGDKQTERYFNEIESKIKQTNSNIYIFLTPFGKQAKDEHFSDVSYKDFIEKLKQIDISNIQEKCRVYIKAFIEHIEAYILSDDSFSDNDCKLICKGREIEETYGKLSKKDREKGVIHDAHSRLLALKSLLFQQFEKQINDKFSTDEWDTRIGDCYIQLYKKKWQKKEIHYEIIITKNINRRGGLYSGIPMSLMIHAENFENKDNKDNKKELKKSLKNVFNDDKVLKNNYKSQVYEEKLDETIGICFDTPANLNEFIKKSVEKLKELSDTATIHIDNFVKDLGKNR